MSASCDCGARGRTGVTAARGFRAGVAACGLRKGRTDLAVIVAEPAASAACVFTTNQVQAAPIAVCREALLRSGGVAGAIVVNAGNANACTGEPGLAAARRTAEAAARLVGIPAHHVLVASTGVIGQQLPVDRLLAGLPQAVSRLAEDGGTPAAEAIMTTDTRRKESHRHVTTRSGAYVVGGMAKGAGMIHPNMATTLGFVTTDAVVPPRILQAALDRVVERTFNRITVDGDTSTNDMLAVLAGGASGISVEGEEALFEQALEEVLLDLAMAIARDGEGAEHLITVEVTGGASEAAALAVARTIASSALVKTAVHGADANWGRIVAAAGRSGVPIRPERLAVAFGDVAVLRPPYVSEFSEEAAAAELRKENVLIRVDLGMGPARATTWTCDLSEAYIRINASYRS